MPISISSTPSELVLPILQKMNPRTLCRFRQTEKWVDNFVEKNRFRISTRSDDKLLLYVSVNTDEYPKPIFKVCTNCDFDATLSHIHMKTTVSLIQDPYEQLAAVFFNLAHFKMETRALSIEHSFNKALLLFHRQNRVYSENVLPIIRQMRIECDWLLFSKLLQTTMENLLEAMNPRSLCRFRQTQKFLDRFVEKNRFRISVRSDDKLLLYVSVNADQHPKPIFKVCTNCAFDDTFSHIHMKTTVSQIQDPYEQLPAIYFNVAHFESETVDIRRPAKKAFLLTHLQNEVFSENVLPILRQMRIDCQWLVFSKLNPTIKDNLLETVRFPSHIPFINKCK